MFGFTSPRFVLAPATGLGRTEWPPAKRSPTAEHTGGHDLSIQAMTRD